MNPEDRYTMVRNPASLGSTFRGYIVVCKACGVIDHCGMLVEAKRVRDEHESIHHRPDPLHQEVGR